MTKKQQINLAIKKVELFERLKNTSDFMFTAYQHACCDAEKLINGAKND